MILILILIFATLLRLINISTLPISLFGDEIDVGYHAWSLFTTLRDYTGHFLPTYISSLAESRAPLLMYVTAPFVGLLGPSSFSVRLPVALLGILNVYQIYILANELFKNKSIDLVLGKVKINVGHLAAILLTITPWHIHYSRAAFEVTLLLALLLGGTTFFLKAQSNSRYYLLSTMLFGLTFYTYSTAVIFTPLLVTSLLFLQKPKLNKSTSSLNLVFVLLILSPFIFSIIKGQASNRFSLISIFNDQHSIDDIVIQRTEPWVKSLRLEGIFHNKPLQFFSVFKNNYIQSLSFNFLFLDGDPLFRHSIGRFGELPTFLIIFLPLGFLYLWQRGDTQSKFIFLWLLLSPIPSSLTQGGGEHATRLFIMLPPLIIISALGIIFLTNNLRKKLITPFLYLLPVLAILFTIAYWHHYSVHYRYQSAKFWHYGFKETFEQLESLKPEGNIYINNTYEPSLLRFAFYTKLKPQEFQKMFTTDVSSPDVTRGFDGFKLGDRYFFGQAQNQGALQALLKPGDLYLGVQFKEIPGNWDWSKEPPAGLKVVGQTNDVFGQPLFSWISAISTP